LSALGLVCLALGLGCDGTAVPLVFPPDAGVTTPMSEIGTAVAQANCEKIDLCCSPEARMRVIGVGENRASCELSLGSFYGLQYQSVERAIGESRVVLNRDTMARCLDQYRNAGCSAPGFAAVAVCSQVLTGVRADGEACQLGLECKSRYCAGPAAARVCTPRKRDGEPCSRSGECASLYCRTGFLAGTCSSQPLDGDSCGGDGFWMTF
jgi:hypothetical protein